ncbi:pheophytinase, chloroplastic-like [Bidens hawaiensis]|uniref:pheophytinase, chloroplastic-like n=1 Tax=Bidens hawaiensis TaxID=980011 RepID=UPI00404B1CF2
MAITTTTTSCSTLGLLPKFRNLLSSSTSHLSRKPWLHTNPIITNSKPRRRTISIASCLIDTSPTESTTPNVSLQTRMWNWKGYSIRYQYAGNSGPALVLVHGFGANSDHWRKNIPVLAESHRVFAIDLIGYGYSDKPNPRELGDTRFYAFEIWGAQLNDFCTEVVKDEAFFICNSIGGLVGLQAAVADPSICKGIMVLNISLRMLHITKQPWFGRPLIRSF